VIQYSSRALVLGPTSRKEGWSWSLLFADDYSRLHGRGRIQHLLHPNGGRDMAETVTLALPDDLARQARAVAASRQQSVEDVLLDWIRRAGTEPVLELLPAQELLAICDLQLDPAQDEELGELLERNQEGELGTQERARLEELMRVYRAGLVRKAQAIKVAVSRGLRSLQYASPLFARL
jgi:hypothetical protein